MMGKVCPGLAVLVAVSMSVASTGSAEEFSILGTRAMGMGGAGVALTRGSLSTYWNPAGLAPPTTASSSRLFDLTFPASATVSTTENALRDLDEVIDEVSDLNFADIENRLTNGIPLTSAQVRELLDVAEELPELEDRGSGLIADLSLGIDLKLWRFGLSMLGSFHGGGMTNLDTLTLALGTGGIGAVIPSLGNSPGTLAGQGMADQLFNTGLVSRGQADQIAVFAEQAGVDVADQDYIDLMIDILEATDANNGGSLDNLITNNTSGIELRGLFTQELGIGYAQPLGELFGMPPFDWISVGATLKVVRGTTFFNAFTLDGLPSFDNVLGDITDDSLEETSVNFGVDVGILVQPLDWVSVGLVARNLNRPAFDFGGPGEYTLDPQVRAGIGLVDLLPGITLAADVDLTRNGSDALPGYRTQLVGAGIEYDFFDVDVFLLRFGVSQNLADTQKSLAVHGGFALNVFGAGVDFAAMVSPEFTEIESGPDADEIPLRGGMGLELSVRIPID